jgi:hypothetical protein
VHGILVVAFIFILLNLATRISDLDTSISIAWQALSGPLGPTLDGEHQLSIALFPSENRVQIEQPQNQPRRTHFCIIVHAIEGVLLIFFHVREAFHRTGGSIGFKMLK